MNAFQIKLLAITTMLIDHIGWLLFPQITVLRIIGRLSFPLFAWLIANGAYHTKNIKAYLIRLSAFAIISQLPYQLALHSLNDTTFKLNIFFSLAFGLLAIFLIDRFKKAKATLLIIIVFSLLAQILNFNYGAAGILAITLFYLFFKNRKKLITTQIAIFVLPNILALILFLQLGQEIIWENFIQPIAALSVIPILLYNGTEGKKMQLAFYLFYPIHLTVLLLIKHLSALTAF
jgi:hypothetical protein